MQNFFDTVGHAVSFDSMPNFSDKLLVFAGKGNANVSALSFLNANLNNNQNFLGFGMSGNSMLLSHQSNPLTNAIAYSQIQHAQLLPLEFNTMADLSKYQVTNMANVSKNVLDTIRANVESTNAVANNSSDNSLWGGLASTALSFFL